MKYPPSKKYTEKCIKAQQKEEQTPQPNPNMWLSKSEIDKMLADERAKTLKEVFESFTAYDYASCMRWLEAELKKVAK